ncbi:hypothetical protein [Ensifer sp. 4252]|uniref:hypothetical protein n=1 Tax=Ensifer sp. 4252 TaxID=3373915 RepID=UPI003D1BD521
MVLDLVREHGTDSGFELAVHRLFGDNDERETMVRIGSSDFVYFRLAKSHVSFLPTKWQQGLNKTQGKWRGCENWWAGYPLIVWAELRTGDNGITGHLKLNAEVGPIADHKFRKTMIDAIKAAASGKGLDRIEFPAGASDKGRLYSRFLRKNTIALNDTRDADEMSKKLAELIAEFEPEFELVASVIAQLPCSNDPSR